MVLLLALFWFLLLTISRIYHNGHFYWAWAIDKFQALDSYKVSTISMHIPSNPQLVVLMGYMLCLC